MLKNNNEFIFLRKIQIIIFLGFGPDGMQKKKAIACCDHRKHFFFKCAPEIKMIPKMTWSITGVSSRVAEF